MINSDPYAARLAQLDAEAAHVKARLAQEDLDDMHMRAAIAAGDPHDNATRAAIAADPASKALPAARALRGF